MEMAVPPYGESIQQAVVSGDLGRMKQVAREAEEHIREYGNVAAALEVLRFEIAKLEARQSGGK
jgi:Domain of unknown function (DUF1843)